MIRPFSADDGSTCGTDASSTGSTEPASAISAWASGAGGEMGTHGVGLGRLEGAQDEGARQVADVLAGQLDGPGRIGHGVPASMPSRSTASSPVSDRRIASSPSRIRLLMVPSGVPVRVAISCWVRPPK